MAVQVSIDVQAFAVQDILALLYGIQHESATASDSDNTHEQERNGQTTIIEKALTTM